MESLSDSSTNMNPEYNDPVSDVQEGPKRKLIINKIKKNILCSIWEIKCNHSNKSNLSVCRVAELTKQNIID